MIRKLMLARFTVLAVIFIFNIFLVSFTLADAHSDFYSWLNSYKEDAFKKGISQNTLDVAFKNVKFLDKVIVYDRKQPEFYEDTKTYVSKRASAKRAKIAIKLLSKNKKLFQEIENSFQVEKEILLALWGIETNFGKHVGKMDIISSLATLSYDKRRREFFSNQLFILLKLIDKKLVNPEDLFGSWAGAYGNFQFMPSTIESYAIDYDKNNKIDLKHSLKDSLASAANYINSIGWKKNEPCFFEVNLTKEVKKKYLNTSARKISHRLKISSWKKKGLVKIDNTDFKVNLKAALIYPDQKPSTPTFLVFSNYEKILKWNRSLRFGISVCTLANKIKSQI